MNIPQMPINRTIVDKEGRLNEDWALYLSGMTALLTANLSNDGYKLPPNTADDITGPLSTIVQEGNVVYDTTNKVASVNLNGVMRKIVTESY